MSAVAGAQQPDPGTQTLDHIAHFVPDIEAAGIALERLGYTVTPFSLQSHRLTADGAVVPAGTGNRCVMLERGYLEFLAPTADTALAAQLRAALSRYVGVHLVALGTSSPEADHERLERQGYAPLPPVALERPIATPQGSGLARFTVVRVPPGTMPEGRIQYCQHHTPELLWQARWTAHRNTVTALAGVILCVPDVREAADRYSRYTGLGVQSCASGWQIDTAWGRLFCTSPDRLQGRWNVEPPALPWIAGAVLAVREPNVLATYIQNAGCPAWPIGDGLRVQLPPELGGIALFQRAGAPMLLDAWLA
jgi:hypothetical protein